ncbi:MAG: 4-(cytidine 5'-diphospho)-2-C-methyl-D-erythritol kinase, partial [Acetobacteraceae bacterium]
MPAVELAAAKINLFLHVTGRRADGHHLLDSLAVFAGAVDELRAEPADTLSLTVDGPFAWALVNESDNLVLRAARALAEVAHIPPRARLVLTKNLPVASGIGGGSADAAATLRALSILWDVEADLPALAARLGADVSVCVASRPARMEGIGEVLSPPPRLPPCGVLLLNPGIPVATADVFRAREGGFSP